MHECLSVTSLVRGARSILGALEKVRRIRFLIVIIFTLFLTIVFARVKFRSAALDTLFDPERLCQYRDNIFSNGVIRTLEFTGVITVDLVIFEPSAVHEVMTVREQIVIEVAFALADSSRPRFGMKYFCVHDDDMLDAFELVQSTIQFACKREEIGEFCVDIRDRILVVYQVKGDD